MCVYATLTTPFINRDSTVSDISCSGYLTVPVDTIMDTINTDRLSMSLAVALEGSEITHLTIPPQ